MNIVLPGMDVFLSVVSGHRILSLTVFFWKSILCGVKSTVEVGLQVDFQAQLSGENR